MFFMFLPRRSILLHFGAFSIIIHLHISATFWPRRAAYSIQFCSAGRFSTGKTYMYHMYICVCMYIYICICVSAYVYIYINETIGFHIKYIGFLLKCHFRSLQLRRKPSTDLEGKIVSEHPFTDKPSIVTDNLYWTSIFVELGTIRWAKRQMLPSVPIPNGTARIALPSSLQALRLPKSWCFHCLRIS